MHNHYLVYETRREEGYDLDNPYSVRFEVDEQNTTAMSQRNSSTKYLESFQVAHFRLLTDTNFLPLWSFTIRRS